MLLECSCGEPLIDSVAKCPACGKPNPACQPSRWRIFWPDISSVPGADDAVQLGYWTASFVAVVGVILGGHLKTGHSWTGQNRPFREPETRVYLPSARRSSRLFLG